MVRDHGAGTLSSEGRLLFMLRRFSGVVVAMCVLLLPRLAPAADGKPIVLVDSDHRTSISLNGDWHVIVDPYDNGYR